MYSKPVETLVEILAFGENVQATRCTASLHFGLNKQAVTHGHAVRTIFRPGTSISLFAYLVGAVAGVSVPPGSTGLVNPQHFAILSAPVSQGPPGTFSFCQSGLHSQGLLNLGPVGGRD